MSGPPAEDYAALADADISDITSNEGNADILMRLRANDPGFTGLSVCTKAAGVLASGRSKGYVAEDARSMGVLGHYSGRSSNVKDLSFSFPDGLDGDTVKPFLEGLQSNRSIERVTAHYSHIPRDFFRTLAPFISGNPNLVRLGMVYCQMNAEQYRWLATALRGSSSLQSLSIGCTTGDHQYQRDEQSVVDLANALKMHPHLRSLALLFFTMGRNACTALSELSQQLVGLQTLRLEDNDINDLGVEALAGGLALCGGLRELDLSPDQEHVGHSSTTARGWRALETLLENPHSNLQYLRLDSSDIDGETVIAFANALAHNNSLEILQAPSSWANECTEEGWEAFSKVLCNTSSVSSTFLSNHTLRSLSVGGFGCPHGVSALLTLNGGDDKKRVAFEKILRHHNDIDMQPLFEWDLKMLPYVVSWFEMAAAFGFEREEFYGNVRGRKLAAIYQFVRGMPEMAIEGLEKKDSKVGGEKRLHSTAFEG